MIRRNSVWADIKSGKDFPKTVLIDEGGRK
jgi:hypothetical protein